MKVFLVIYSEVFSPDGYEITESGICGIYSNKDAANDKYKDLIKYGDKDKYSIEEYDVQDIFKEIV
jgi:hypothetical protein